jgi:UDP-glucose 4-epimerase
VRVLVTGGAGFIGSHVVDELLLHKFEVVIVDNLSTGLRENINSAAEFVKLDIAEDDMTQLFSERKFDFVIHLAAQTAVPRSLVEPDFDARVNVLGTVNLLEASRKTGVKKILFASSAAVYGDVESIPLTEEVGVQPTSFYGLSKVTAERYFKLYREVFGLDYAVLRYANVYGERQGDSGEGGVVSIFCRKFFNNQPINIFGDGGQTRDFIYVGDVARANCQALITPAASGVFNISTFTETSVNELAEIMAQISGKQLKKEYFPARGGDIYHSKLDNRAAIKTLQWAPRVALTDGLRATYSFLKQRGE